MYILLTMYEMKTEMLRKNKNKMNALPENESIG